MTLREKLDSYAKEREEAIKLAREHCITAEDLLVYLSTRGAR